MQAFIDFFTGALNDFAWLYMFLPCVMVGGILLTVRTKAVQFSHFGYAMKNTVGKMFKKTEAGKGAVTPLQAVTTALAATVGTGNIVGTSQAIALGGYGAVFWLWVAALLGMVIKYSEVVLSIQYRQRDEKGDWVGGPMYYIAGIGPKWKWLAMMYAALAGIACFGIGNMSQVNAITGSITNAITAFFTINDSGITVIHWVIGLSLAALVALILLGGIKRIGKVAEKLVPIMSVFYVLVCLGVIFSHAGNIGGAFAKIFTAAFSPRAVLGAASGIALKEALVWGLRRSAFSNEAGLGSAAIAHAAAETPSAVHQGLYGIFEVFMDTIVICTLTSLVVLCSGAATGNYGNNDLAGVPTAVAGFASVFGDKLGSLILAVGLLLFATSTILGWALYGTRCAEFLFGSKIIRPYQVLFCLVVIAGSVANLKLVWDISDTLNGLMAIPNLIGILLLSPVVIKLTKEHFNGVKAGKLE